LKLTGLFAVLGASLHDILTRLKAQPQRFPQLELLYSREQPVQEPVAVTLPANGVRLRFDGPEQRLRLIEVVDFTKNHITFKDRDLLKPPSTSGVPSSPIPGESSSGPTFKHIYHKLLGPTYAGEYIPPAEDDKDEMGNYVLSYPGVAFTFRLPRSAYSPNKDVVSLLSSATSQAATSMAIFSGDSWAKSRETLWTEVLPSVKAVSVGPRGKDVSPDEISLVRIYGGGRIQLFRKWTNSSFWIHLGETSPQELVAELGPPNATYRKNDQRMTIHKARTASNSRARPNGIDLSRPDDSTDTDQSSAHTESDDSNDEAVEEDVVGNVSGECFYNYFYLGFDVLVSTPVQPSRQPPLDAADGDILPPDRPFKAESPDRLVATKLVLHGNVPGSYEFNRHRRCRWEVSYLTDPASGSVADSETRYAEIEAGLHERWKSVAPDGEEYKRQRGMVLNRGWGDSPGSSCELLGGWEDNSATVPGARLPGRGVDGGEESTTTLYGFPGLVFEVLRNGYVNTVTVF
jgi:hypothetical protein